MIAKHDGRYVTLYNNNGTFLRNFSVNGTIVDVDVNNDEDTIVVVFSDGSVALHNELGHLLGNILLNDACSARWSGDEIAIKLRSGATQIYTKNRTFVRNIY